MTDLLAPPGTEVPDADALDEVRRDLEQLVDGEVRFDAGSRAAYSTDGSNFRQVPLGLVVPRTVDAAAEAVRVCRDHRVPAVASRLAAAGRSRRAHRARVQVEACRGQGILAWGPAVACRPARPCPLPSCPCTGSSLQSTVPWARRRRLLIGPLRAGFEVLRWWKGQAALNAAAAS